MISKNNYAEDAQEKKRQDIKLAELKLAQKQAKQRQLNRDTSDANHTPYDSEEVFHGIDSLASLGLDDFDYDFDEEQDWSDEIQEEFDFEVTEEEGYSTSAEPARRHPRKAYMLAGHILSTAGALGSILLIVTILNWMIYNVHPGLVTGDFVAGTQKYNFVDAVSTYMGNHKAVMFNQYLSEDKVIKKVYKIQSDALSAPVPNPDCFGSTSYAEADRVNLVIAKARDYGLLGADEDVVYNTNVNFYQRGDIKYYLDETIMVICWKEIIDGKVISLMEVKLSDVSQFRRKLAGDTFGAGVEMFCSQLSKQTNSVAAANADYYAFRNLGLSCYDGEVKRYGSQGYGSSRLYNCIDTLFIDGNGDFQFFERGTQMSKEEIEDYMKENGISFSLSFGPILVKDGEMQFNETYPIGQIDELYSRAGIGQVDTLHYIYMVISNTGKGSPRATTDGFAQIMYDKGAVNAYNLDGGQTGEYTFNGSVESLVDFGNERTVSDIIYFGSSLPEEDWEPLVLEE